MGVLGTDEVKGLTGTVGCVDRVASRGWGCGFGHRSVGVGMGNRGARSALCLGSEGSGSMYEVRYGYGSGQCWSHITFHIVILNLASSPRFRGRRFGGGRSMSCSAGLGAGFLVIYQFFGAAGEVR